MLNLPERWRINTLFTNNIFSQFEQFHRGRYLQFIFLENIFIPGLSRDHKFTAA